LAYFWIFKGHVLKILEKIHGKYLEIRVFGAKMDICGARNAQKNERKPSVATVCWIVGPNGAPNWPEID